MKTCLIKSRVACNSYPYCLNIVMECLRNNQTSSNAFYVGLLFAKQMVNKSLGNDDFATYFPKVVKKLLRYINDDDPWLSAMLQLLAHTHDKRTYRKKTLPPQARKVVYELLGDVARFKCIHYLLVNNLTIVKLLFKRLKQENDENDKEVQRVLIETLQKLQTAFLHASNEQLMTAKKFLLSNEIGDCDNCRWMVLEWLNNLYPFSDSVIRMENLFEIDNKNKNIRECAIKSFIPSTYKHLYQQLPQFDEERSHFKHESYPAFDNFVAQANKRILVCLFVVFVVTVKIGDQSKLVATL